MDDAGVKDTAAYKIVRQVMDHTWGADEKIDEREFVKIYQAFCRDGGSWYALMDGDMASVAILEQSIDSFVEARNMTKVASRVAGLKYPR